MMRGDRWLLVLPLALTAVGLVMVYSSSSFYALHRAITTRTTSCAGSCSAPRWAWSCSCSPARASSPAPARIVRRPRCSRCACVLLVRRGGRWATCRTAPRAGCASASCRCSRPTSRGVAAVVFLAWWLKRRPVGAARILARGRAAARRDRRRVAGADPQAAQPEHGRAAAHHRLRSCCSSRAPAALPARCRSARASAFVALALATHPYQMGRVQARSCISCSSGGLDTREAGWQLNQSLIAIGSGGVLRPRAGRRACRSCCSCPRRTPTSSFRSSPRNSGLLGSTALLVGPRPVPLARHARRGALLRTLCRPAGGRTHRADRSLRTGQPGRGHGARAHHGTAAAVRLVRRLGAARESGRGRACCIASAPSTARPRRSRASGGRGRPHEDPDRRRRHGRTRVPGHRRGRGDSSASRPRLRSGVRRARAAASRRRPCPRPASAIRFLAGSGFSAHALVEWPWARARQPASDSLQAIVLVLVENPHVVLGTGGYVSAPVALAARLLGRPLILQEQNSVPGHREPHARRASPTRCTCRSSRRARTSRAATTSR